MICNDDSYCNSLTALQSVATFSALANQTYYIILTGFSGTAGLFTLAVSGVPCVFPATPDSLVALSSGADIALDWAPVSGAVYYNVYRATTVDVPAIPANLIAQTALTSYLDAGVTLGATVRYFYTVTATNAGASLNALPPINKADVAPVSRQDTQPVKAAATPPARRQSARPRTIPTAEYRPAYTQGNTQYVPNPNKPVN